MRAVIFAGGEITDYGYIKSLLREDDMLFAADSGMEHIKRLSLVADVMIGDMDSVKSEISGKEIIRLEVMKDETDTEAAALLAVERGAEELLILGAMGSRKDHSIANILLLKRFSDMKVKASIVDEKNEIYYLDSEIELCGKKDDIISIIPLSNLEGITTTGLFYKLDNDVLYMGTARGVSNVMTDNVCTIRIKTGNALVIKSRD